MKKLAFAILTLILSISYAQAATVKLAISGNTHHFYLCIAGEGCLSMDANRSFPLIMPDINNLLKFVIVDGKNMKRYEQNSPASCNIKVTENQNLTIRGNLSVNGHSATIKGLSCKAS